MAICDETYMAGAEILCRAATVSSLDGSHVADVAGKPACNRII